MVELMINEYRNCCQVPSPVKKRPEDRNKKEEEVIVLRELQKCLARLTTTDLHQLKSI
jgi:hypothetical protein